jgi:hypothetical protein
MKPCTLGKRHAWVHAHDQVVQSGGPSTIRISKRGVYLCACGAKKLGQPAV